MRSVGVLAVVTATLVLTSACGDGSGTPPTNEAPVAKVEVPACTVSVPCTFRSTSTDDEAVTEWSWDFDDDNQPDADTETAAWTYGTVGDHSVRLTVYDAHGLSHTTTTAVPVANTPPTAAFTHECDAADCTFTSTSSDVAPGTIASHAWTFGDGATADVTSPTHSYTVTAPTDFTVTLTVTDNEGATDVETRTITVSPVPTVNTPPTANFTQTCTRVDCTFISTSSDPAPGSIASHAWTFGDGGTANGNSPSHRYSVTAPTDFTVTLTVTDNQGATAVATKTITVDPTPPANEPPVARFTFSCASTVCTFVNTSYDHGGQVTASAWTFGDGGTSTETSPTHGYTVTTATEFTVTLTVTDDEGATGVASQTFTLDPNATNVPPTAAFDSWCYGDGCIFTSTSTDAAPGTILNYAWTFGDGTASEWNNWIFAKHLETHVYSITGRTSFTVTLTVTDNEGATSVATKTITLTPLPPAVQGCTTSGKRVECVLDIPARSTLRLKLLQVQCDLRHWDLSRVSTPPPVGDQLYLSVCSQPVGKDVGVFGGTMDELWVYESGTQARIWFTQGDERPSEPPRGPPAGQVSGTFPNWTLNFDDGDNAGAPGEPNFTDLIIGVQATQR
jgi:PKD repeat protein